MSISSNCGNLDRCSFFSEYQRDQSKRLALKGFVSMYCKGYKQDQCIRKGICNKLGSPLAVPKNMMPNGKPLFGTSNENWRDEVFEVLDDLNIPYFRKIMR